MDEINTKKTPPDEQTSKEGSSAFSELIDPSSLERAAEGLPDKTEVFAGVAIEQFSSMAAFLPPEFVKPILDVMTGLGKNLDANADLTLAKAQSELSQAAINLATARKINSESENQELVNNEYKNIQRTTSFTPKFIQVAAILCITFFIVITGVSVVQSFFQKEPSSIPWWQSGIAVVIGIATLTISSGYLAKNFAMVFETLQKFLPKKNETPKPDK